MKTAKIFWSLSSILINVVIGIYIYLQQNGPQSNLAERFQYINENWAMYGGHWKVEFLLMVLMMIGAVYFTVYWKSISWTIISIGQFIVLLTYPFMLGGYQNTPFELASMSNQMATVTFILGNLVFFSGLTYMYFQSQALPSWLRKAAITLSIIATLMFLLIYIEIITWSQAIVMAPIINVLYLINAYYGFKIDVDTEPTVVTN